MPDAARVFDPVQHPTPPVLTGSPGSLNVFIGGKPAWRGVMAAVAAGLSAAKKTSDAAIKAAETAAKAAMGTPAAPAAKAAEQVAKSTAAATMGAAIRSAAGGADVHMCLKPLPIPPHGPGVVITPSKTVYINGLGACRKGDTILEAVGPPNKIKAGFPKVKIGG
ncbi:MAG: hypothetical protein QNK37_01600 [Acidobacteriota bacterium]|nr:hypothetical protein [Acidobacteriota bacterium]